MRFKRAAAGLVASVMALTVAVTPVADKLPVVSSGLSVKAAAETYGNFEYSVNDDGVTIESYTGSSSTVVIPKEIDGKKVTGIGDNAFNGNVIVTSVTIPDTVTSIDQSAFYGCTKLSQVNLPPNLQFIGWCAFSGCTSLTSVEIPKSLTECDSDVFADSGLTTATFEDGTTSILSNMFNSAEKLVNVTIPDTVTSIDQSAFYGCTKLSQVNLPPNLQFIGWCAFSGCTSLTSVEIPKSLTECDSDVFADSGLTTATFEDGTTSILSNMFNSAEKLVNVTIPDTVTSIDQSAFYGCTKLSQVNLPPNLQFLGWRAFAGCKSLTSVEIPKSLTECDSDVFADSGLTTVTFEKGTTKIANSAFHSADKLVSVTIPNTVTSIGNSAFYGCTSLEKIELPDSVTSIGDSAFYGCTGFEKIDLPDSVTSIEQDAFKECTKLSQIDLPKNLEYMGSCAFMNCTSLTSVEIPKSLTDCRWDVFTGSGLTTVTFEEGTTRIASNVVTSVSTLINVTIPETVTSIGSYAFAGCNNLKKIVIPESVISIDEGAFNQCKKLSEVNLPKNLTTLGQVVFGECESLKTIKIPKSLTECDWSVFGKSGLTTATFEEGVTSVPDRLFNNASNLTNVTIPDTVTSIGSDAFSSCSSLQKIDIPDSVISIGDSAFNLCDKLSEITLPKDLETLGSSAFSGCTSLTSISVPENISKIQDSMFDGCTSLVTVEMGDKVASIGNNAFNDCTALKNITLSPVTEYIGSSAFSNCDSLESIVIPDKVTAIYSSAFSDCDKLSSVTLSKALERIGESAFNNCDMLTSIKIPDSVKTIGYMAFYDCEKLAVVDMGNGVSWLYSEAFRLCPALTKVVLSNNLTSIPEYAFADCVNLTDVTIYPGVTEIATNAFSYASKVTMRGLKGSYAETYANDRGMTFEAITSVNASELTIKYKSLTGSYWNDYIEYIPEASYTYTGEAIKPEIKVYFGSYELTEGTDYKLVSYENNVNIGNAVCTIEGLGVYSGKTSSTYKIVAADISDFDFGLEYGSLDYTGEEIKPAVTCDGLTEGIDFTVSYKDNINAGTAKAIITGIGNYSGTYTLEFTINPVTICTDVSQLQSKHPYDGNVHDVYVYNGAEGAKNLYLTFSDDTQFEAYNDYLYIYDVDGNLIGAYTDDELSGKTIRVPGSYVKLILNTNSTNNEYGFRVVSVTDSIECTTHTFGDWVITEEPTCTTTGTQTRTCSVCKKVETQTIEALGHTEVIDKAVAATCTKTGLTEGIHCSVCDAVIKAQEVVPATGKHSFGNWKITKAATCTAEGTQTRTCSGCGKVETQTIAKTAHKYVNTVVKPTYTAQGYTLHKCSVCGTSYKDTYTAKLTLAKVTGVKLGGRAADALRINWSKNASADGYIVEMYQGNKWVRVAKIISNATTTYRASGLKASSVYKFRVRAYKMEGKAVAYGAYSTELAVRTNPSVMTGAKLSGRAADALRINWSKNASADGYIVEMYQGGKWVRVAKITSNNTTTFRKAGLKAGTAYKFRVKAYKMSGKTALYGNYSATVTARTNPSIVKGVKIGGKAKDALRVNWTKNASAQGYIVEMYKGGKWVRVAKITNGNTTTFRKAGLAKNTAYKFRVCAYYMSGKTALYGNYGSVSGKTAAK